MWVGLDSFSRLLVDTTLATAVLLSLIILLMLLSQQPARRILLARAAILLALFMYPISAASPFADSDARSWLTGLEPDAGQTGAGSPRAITAGTPSLGKPAPQPSSTATTVARSWWKGPWPLRVLALIYLAGVVVAILWTVLGFWGIHRLVARSLDPSAATRGLYDELTRQMDELVSVPRLRVSLRIQRPVLLGLFGPCILLPAACDDEQFDRESLKIILLHELAHAAQGDHHFSVAANVTQNLWFFLPFLWWLLAQLRIDQEFLADHKVVTLTSSPAGYATRLVTLAMPTRGPSPARLHSASPFSRSGLGTGGDVQNPLFQRVLMLLHCPYPLEQEPPRWWSLATPPLVVGLAILSVWLSQTLVMRASRAAGPAAPATVPGTFQVNQFVASPATSTGGGRTPFYTLPLLLPERFDLSVEIQASPAALRRIRLLGLALDPTPAADPGTEIPPESPGTKTTWHHVRIWRQGGKVSIVLDGQPRTGGGDPGALTEWLTVEPAADETVTLKNLIVNW